VPLHVEGDQSEQQKNDGYFSATPWKIKMEPENDGLVQMIFLFNWGDV